MEYGHGAITLGSEIGAGVRHLTVSHCFFRRTDRGLRIKTRRGRGRNCRVDGVTFERIRMEGVLTPFVINMWYNCCDPDRYSEYVYSRDQLPVDERTPSLGSFCFTDIQCTDAQVAASGNTVTKEQLLDKCADSLSAVDPEMRYLIQEYHDGLLLYDISNQLVWDKAAKDEEALANYFKKHKKKYAWDEPRYKGMAYHVKDPADVKAVAKCVKKLKFDDWNEALRSTFNNDSILRIRVEKGLFKKGDNKLIDREVFKVKDVQVDSVKGFPIDAVYGKLLKKPQDYTDVRALVVTDLQDEMERAWVADLRKKYAVTVNEEVLKTVNKHE